MGQFFHQQSEVITGELPLKGRGHFLVAAFERGQARGDLGHVLEVVGAEYLSLDDRKVHLHLIQPTGVDWHVNEHEVPPASGEAIDGLSTTMTTCPVVHHPEHAPGADVGLDRHHLVDESGERLDTGLRLAAPEDLGPVDVPGRQVLTRPRAFVLEFNSSTATGSCGFRGLCRVRDYAEERVKDR